MSDDQAEKLTDSLSEPARDSGDEDAHSPSFKLLAGALALTVGSVLMHEGTTFHDDPATRAVEVLEGALQRGEFIPPHGSEMPSEYEETIDPTVVLVSVTASLLGELVKMRDQLRERDELGRDNGMFFLA